MLLNEDGIIPTLKKEDWCMAQLNEAFQISIVCIGIVFACLIFFNVLIQLMGSYFQRTEETKKSQSVSVKSPVEETADVSTADKRKIAAIMTAFQEEFGDRIADIQISRVNRKESSK